ncbi:MAG: cytochrome c oxidase subunit II [Cyanobacteria bacterium RI_101]|nr:cytochrome c oxidase subunit II [Cyanobacteria bacterium RI_101]
MPVVNAVLLAVYVLFSLGASHWLGQKAYDWLPAPAALEAEPIGDLFSAMTTLGSLIFLGVFGVLLYSLLFYRAKGNEDGAAIRGNTKLEITWTVIPILLVAWLAWYSFQTYERLNVLGPLPLVNHPHGQIYAQLPGASPFEPRGVLPETENSAPLKIDVKVRQWAWEFIYPETGKTSAELHLPINRRAQFHLTSEDVIHGFYVPEFRVKQDIIPNRDVEFSVTPSRVGEYQLRDSQFSGVYFALMTAPVLVETPQTFQAWLTGSQTKPALNLAQSEHQTPPATVLRSGWPRVAPKSAGTKD